MDMDTPRKKMRLAGFGQDRLSDLPKYILSEILLHLPLKDAVKTSILSRRWRYEWTNLPQLVFDSQSFPKHPDQSQIEYDTKLVKIVDRVLLLHQKPILSFNFRTELATCTDHIDIWISSLTYSLKKFVFYKHNGPKYNVPSHLFSCKEITLLALGRCTMVPPDTFRGFSNLKVLMLHSVSITKFGLETLISKSPLLRILCLSVADGYPGLTLRSESLVCLGVQGPLIDISFERAPLLSTVVLNIEEQYQNIRNGATCKLIKTISCIPRIRQLKLYGNTLKHLSTSYVPTQLPAKCLLDYLDFHINFEDIQQMLTIFCIFRSSPLLRKVHLESISNVREGELSSVGDFLGKQEVFSVMFNQLRMIEITKYKGTVAELKFMEIVLGNAPVLEMAKIKLAKDIANEAILLKTLNRFRRNSAKAELVIA